MVLASDEASPGACPCALPDPYSKNGNGVQVNERSSQSPARS